MKHIGDITKINGKLIDPVDVITGGSPCQDLSVAGLRKGLAGQRSGLFIEQIRIIKEMREATNGKQPRFMVWENVPGAFSSNKGEDFRCVLEETARVADQDAVIPRPEKGKWTPAGCIMGDGWSIAWRVHDAQFWGVPQRRKRIALVADFRGGDAPEILFEREGMPGNTEESGKEREGIACDVEENADVASWGFEPGAAKRLNPKTRFNEELSPTLRSEMEDNQVAVVYGMSSFDSNAMKSSNPHSGIYEAETSRTLDLNGGNPACNQGGMMVVQSAGFDGNMGAKAGNIGYEEEKAPTLTARMGTGGNQVNAVCVGNGQLHQMSMSEQANTLDAMHDQQAVLCFQNTGQGWWNESDIGATLRTPCGGDSTKANLVAAVDCRNLNEHQEVSGTLQCKQNGGYSLNYQNPIRIQEIRKSFDVQRSIVRRLTPLEAERLQGFPDGWTDIGDWLDSKDKKHKGDADSPRYKALGNSIALPFWKWMACKMIRYDVHTMGSLFDGIGGFPLVFSECGVEPVWGSEIEEFCIAVTNKRFNEV